MLVLKRRGTTSNRISTVLSTKQGRANPGDASLSSRQLRSRSRRRCDAMCGGGWWPTALCGGSGDGRAIKDKDLEGGAALLDLSSLPSPPKVAR